MSTNNANNSGAGNKKPSTTSGEPPKAGRVDAPSGNTNKKSDVHFDSLCVDYHVVARVELCGKLVWRHEIQLAILRGGLFGLHHGIGQV